MLVGFFPHIMNTEKTFGDIWWSHNPVDRLIWLIRIQWIYPAIFHQVYQSLYICLILLYSGQLQIWVIQLLRIVV